MSLISELAKNAAIAAQTLAVLGEDTKNVVLRAMASALRQHAEFILKANRLDLDNAKENGLGSAMIDRLTLDNTRIESMAQGIETIATLEDPVGTERIIGTQANGLKISKMKIPLGVV